VFSAYPGERIKSRIFRARSQLRQQLAKYNYSLALGCNGVDPGPGSGIHSIP